MKTWNNTDKSAWKIRGKWDSEPDKAHWIHNDLDCLIVRGPHGALCGYVGVPESSQYFGKDYENVSVECHGGLTFANRCQPTDDESDHICHPKEGAANEEVWWLGFDCAHSGDTCPKHLTGVYPFQEHAWETYKDFDYVKAEVERLAEQLA